MKHFYLALLICGISLSSFAQTKIIAHRGHWDTANSAQNSITSIYKAAEIGCYGAEFDVQMTSDGEFVVFHDDKVNGLTIADTPYEKLRDIRLKNGEILPTLEQYLIHFKNCPDIKVILEIKTGKTSPEKITQTISGILKLVDKYELQPRTEYIAFNMDISKELIKQRPSALVFYLNGDASPAQLKELGFAGLDYHFNRVLEDSKLIEEAHKLGLKVNVWTVNNPDMMKQLIDKKVDFITTDKPEVLKELLEK